ncbi:MAG: helix-turn-helix domain-containing protein [Spirochaetaceae bacterium]|jgi:transcriptional regulator with XRE-family HTH domain|nr:helix-turn-helix domain-containing protein [Spirochaetaceae bacterium]
MIQKMGFRENLKAELSYQGMLVKELAVLSGVSRHTLDNYLNARGHIPAADIAVKIARALGVSVEYLVTGEERPQEKAIRNRGADTLPEDIGKLSAGDRRLIYGIIQLFCARRKNIKSGTID